jgi:hypothetical protein
MTPVHPNGIQPGDLVEVKIGDDVFPATVRSKNPKAVSLLPENPILHLYRYCHYTDIVRVISRPEAEEAVA